MMKKILNNVYKDTKEKYFLELEKKDFSKEKKFIITLNPESIVMSKTDTEIKEMLLSENSNLVVDSIEVVKVSKLFNIKIKERVPGIEIAQFLLEEANKKKYSLYLFGTKEEILNNLVTKIKKEYPNIKILGATNGYVKNKDKVMKKIIKLKPDLCFIGLGVPLQEKLIFNNYNDIKNGCYIGIGGALDVFSGHKKRAPKIFLKLNLEWLYRITKEPWRLKRFFKYNIRLLVECILLKLGIKHEKN